MTNEQKFLLEINVNDVVTNRHETDSAKLVYVSDVLREWIKYNQLLEPTNTTEPGHDRAFFTGRVVKFKK